MLNSGAISPVNIENHQIQKELFGMGRLTGISQEENLLIVQGEHGILALNKMSEGIIRIKLFPELLTSRVLDMTGTIAVVKEAEHHFPEIQETKEAYLWETKHVILEISKSDCSLRFMDKAGNKVVNNSLLLWDEKMAVSGTFNVSPDTHYYGLGEKTGFLDKRGERYEMWNSDVFSPHVPEIEALYQSIPFLIVHEPQMAYGIYLDNPGRTFFDMRSQKDIYSIHTETGSFDYYFIAGPQIKDVLKRYTSLTGRMQLPPQWALGYHQSRYSYLSQDEVLQLAHTFREKDIPCDVIHLDIHHMNEYRVFTFDPVRFPDPAAMIQELRELGIRIVPIVDPGVKVDSNYKIYNEGVEGGHLCLKPDGEPFEGPVWPGPSVFPDFTDDKTGEWWGGLHRFYTEAGIEGIWNDMNEPAVFSPTMTMDEDTIHNNNGSPVSHGTVHNLYGLLMCKATAEGLKRNLDGRRSFVLTRAGYAGIQRYAAVWTGDNRSYWEHMAMSMPMVLNLGLSGVAFAGPDVGGFAYHASGELLARWIQMGALFPFFRNHSEQSSLRQEPWSFGPEIEEICRDYIKLRYRMMPLIYSLFREAAETGMPIIRPLILEYPSDPEAYNLCDQFLLGSDLLAAPIYRPGSTFRAVYLPEGTWYDYWTGEGMEGGGSIVALAPLNILPLYVKGGAIVPQVEPVSSTLMEGNGNLRLDVYCTGSANNIFELYDDDGESYAYEKGKYNLFKLHLLESSEAAEFSIDPAHLGYTGKWTQWTVHFKNLQITVRSQIEGLPDGGTVETDAGVLTLTFPQPKDNVRLRVIINK
ncbi:glycoside hydrolase family 31 protein [Paenibacillus ihuae]|uniref:glycoside hydrolase family 31 protein n=1 Tax=Paenibacillus ihuae TaxID=1232431 RepID=UPI0006D56528|nr:TIM-barrel domain-containing protein [Paenibacillus ihuae]